MTRKSIIKAVITIILSISLTVPTVINPIEADNNRGIFSKDEEILNYGNELLGMENSYAFGIYQELMKINTDTQSLEYILDTPITLEGQNQEDIQKLNVATLKVVSDSFQIAIDAFCKDYPEIFWIDFAKVKANMGIVKYSGESNYKLNKIVLTFQKQENIKEDVSDAYDSVILAVNECLIEADKYTDNFDKIKIIHDYLCKKNVYDKEGPNIFNAYGALVDGIAVCEGYSEAFKLICDKAGIPCVLIVGSDKDLSDSPLNHMWNYCLMDDGKWYALDVTWDDQKDGTYRYDFFLIGAETYVERIGKKFNESHFASGDFSNTNKHIFALPVLNNDAYPHEPIMTSEPIKTPAPTGTPIPNETATPAPSQSADDTEKPSESPNPSESQVPATSEPLKLGDVDGNDKVEANDALIVLKSAAKITTINEDAFLRADVDKSLKADAKDALYILQFVAKIINSFDNLK